MSDKLRTFLAKCITVQDGMRMLGRDAVCGLPITHVWDNYDDIGPYRAYVLDQCAAEGAERAAREGKANIFLPSLSGELVPLGSVPYFEVARYELPKDRESLNKLETMLSTTDVQLALVGQNKITVIRIWGWSSWMEAFSWAGYEITAGGKVQKRIKTLQRVFAINGVGPIDELRMGAEIQIVSPTEFFCSTDTSMIPPEKESLLLDGAVVLSRQWFENVVLSQVSWTDPVRSEILEDRIAEAMVYNFRLEGDWTYEGQRYGLAKGNAFLSDALPEGVVMMGTIDAFKKEYRRVNGTWRIGLEPQPGIDHVRTNPQTLINLWGSVFDIASLEKALSDYLVISLRDVKEGNIPINFREIMAGAIAHDTESESLPLRLSYLLYEYLASGGVPSDSPWVIEQAGRTVSERLRDKKGLALKFPVPCAVHWQIISESCANMVGMAGIERVERGTARVSSKWRTVIVNDEDFVENAPNHGGPDFDDHYDILFRSINGVRKIIAVRSPNNMGEYSIYDFVDGDWYPVWINADGQEESFPEIPDPSLLPPKITEIEAQYRAKGQSFYRGLPSAQSKRHAPQPPAAPESYQPRHVISAVADTTNSGGVGYAVNILMVYCATFGKLPETLLCPLEEMIDTYAQGGSKADRQAITDYTRQLANAIVGAAARGNYPDFTLASQRAKGLLRARNPIATARKWYTELTEVHTSQLTIYDRNLRDYANSCWNNVPKIHELGRRYAAEAERVVRSYRRGITAQNAGDFSQGMNWNDIYTPVLDAINSYPLPQRHDFILALVSYSLRNPTISGNRIERIVANPRISMTQTHLNPRTHRLITIRHSLWLEALRHYGFLAELHVSNNQIVRSDKHIMFHLICEECHQELLTEDPVLFQRWQQRGYRCRNHALA